MTGAHRHVGETTPPSADRTESSHEPTQADAAGPYICPMHPEVRQDRPGTCPKCGMKLEPARPGEPQRDDEHPPDHLRMLRDMRAPWLWTNATWH